MRGLALLVLLGLAPAARAGEDVIRPPDGEATAIVAKVPGPQISETISRREVAVAPAEQPPADLVRKVVDSVEREPF